MQMKFSYRALKWTLLAGTAASLATACVVTTSGDGGNIGGDFSFAGDGTSTSGKTTGGSGASAGTATSGSGGTAGSTGGTSTTTAGTSTTTAGQGEGGAAYVPGLCQTDDPTPTMLPACDPNPARDDGKPCKICMKAKCCEEWQTCNGDTPTSACAYGATFDGLGQFDCIQDCYSKNDGGETDPSKLLESCASGCTNQCEAADNGNVLDATNELIACANDPATCQTECFPFN